MPRTRVDNRHGYWEKCLKSSEQGALLILDNDEMESRK